MPECHRTIIVHWEEIPWWSRWLWWLGLPHFHRVNHWHMGRSYTPAEEESDLFLKHLESARFLLSDNPGCYVVPVASEDAPCPIPGCGWVDA